MLNEIEDYYSLEYKNIAKKFETSLEYGLSSSDVLKRREKYGANVLAEVEKVSPLMMFLLQFKDFLVYLLIGAALASIFFGDFIEAFIIIVIVVLNSVLGFTQEYRAEQSLEKLKELTGDDTLVLRDGKETRVETRDLVPGDILMLYEGETIAADARIFKSSRLKVEEGILTGESVPVEKQNKAIISDYVSLAEQDNMAFMGTTTVKGRGKAIITGTGMNTEMGKIAASTLATDKQSTPLQETLDQLGKLLGVIVIVICLFVLGAQLLDPNADVKESIETAIALAVSAVPEGLAAAVTLTLAIGVQRMVTKNAVIKKLPAVETLGSVEVICTDKTGTLTQNKMSVIKLWTATLGEVDISGTGYNPKGNFTRMDQEEIKVFDDKLNDFAKESSNLQKYLDLKESLVDKKITIRNHWDIYEVLKAGSLCNTASINYDSQKNEWLCEGDPTEGALLVGAMKANLKSYWDDKYELKQNGELFFDSDRKRMSMIFDRIRKPKIEEWEFMKGSSETWAYMKGAPEAVLDTCTHILLGDKIVTLDEDMRKAILEKNSEFSQKAYRVLAFASRNIPEDVTIYNEANIEKNMTFLGLQCMIDPPRENIEEAIMKCKNAGIRIIMITGDQLDTAMAIAESLDLKPFEDAIYTCATARELEQMSDEEFKIVVKDLDVCARASPSIKQRIVTCLQEEYGLVVAMTGDGVNDAPALKKADIGVAMGITGTDVSREAADMVLMDDNFATIVDAVEEGRKINANMKKFIRYMLSSNFDEILVVFVATVLLGLPSPYLALSILWINLLTDGLPSLALSVDPGDPNLMKKKPLGRNKHFINEILMFSIIAGIISFAATMYFFTSFDLNIGGANYEENLVTARTMALTVSVLFELFQVFLSKSSDDKPFIFSNMFDNVYLWGAVIFAFVAHLAIIYIEPLAEIFKLTALSLTQWLDMLIFVIVGIIILDFVKIGISKIFSKYN